MSQEHHPLAYKMALIPSSTPSLSHSFTVLNILHLNVHLCENCNKCMNI